MTMMWAAALGVALWTFPAAAAMPVPARSGESFLDTIGINTHLSTPEAGAAGAGYANFAAIQRELRAIHVRHVRDTLLIGGDIAKLVELNRSLGIKFDLLFDYYKADGGAAVLDRALAGVAAHPELIEAIEGPNEPDWFGFHYDGLQGAAAAVAAQRRLFEQVRHMPAFATVPVYCLSLSNPAPSGIGATLGDVSPFCDAAPSHVYVENPLIGRLLPHDYIDRYTRLSERFAPGRTRVITEGGWTTRASDTQGVDEATQAKYLLAYLLDAYDLGIPRTYIYELAEENADPQDTDNEYHFGLFHSDGAPKPAALMLGRLEGVVGGVVGIPGSLGFEVGGLPATGRHVLFRRGDGAFVIALWNEAFLWNARTHTRVPAPPVRLTLRFDRPPARAVLVDALSDAAPTPVAVDARGWASLDLPDHPVFVVLDRARE